MTKEEACQKIADFVHKLDSLTAVKWKEELYSQTYQYNPILRNDTVRSMLGKLSHVKQLLARRRESGVKNRINSIMIETAAVCNLRCKMCPTTSYTIGKGLMKDSIFEKILGVVTAYDIKIINMTGWGEPLLDLKLEERISQLRAIKPNIKVVFLSNGTLFTQRRVDQIVRSGVDTIYISFDASCKETYERIRINSNYERTVEGLKLLSSLRDRRKTTLGAVFVIMADNFDEMEPFVQLFHSLEFDFVLFKSLNVISSKENLKSTVNKTLAYKKFLKLRESFSRKIMVYEEDLSINRVKNDCLVHAASGNIFVSSTGDVSSCCNLGHHTPNYTEGSFSTAVKEDNFFSFGNLASEDFRQIIESERYTKFVELFKHSCLPESCVGCRLVSKKLYNNVRKI